MQRQPAIHIRLKDLSRILKKLLGKEIHKDFDSLVKQIGLEGKVYQIENRKLLQSNKKVSKKIQQSETSTFEITSKFNRDLMISRRLKKHRSITPIREGTKDWLFLKEIAGLVYKFCQDHKMPFDRVSIEYINMALDKMNKFSLYKIKAMNEQICEGLIALEEIRKDKTPNITDQMHLWYNGKVNERTGLNWDYKKIPDKYVYFIRAKEEAQRIGADPMKYLLSQFEGMQFRDGIPDPLQLVGPKALERYVKYAYEKGLGSNQKTTEASIDFSKILKK